MVKDNASILDCTCGNRSIYKIKYNKYILFTDIEEELTIKPDILMDIRKTDFEDKRFKIIIFDPPHEWGRIKNSTMFTTPSKEIHNKKWSTWERNTAPRYYGGDKYKNQSEFIEFIIDAEKEIYRILKDDGLLLFKWSEYKMNKYKILAFFKRWDIIIDIPIKHKAENAKGSYWFIMMKNEEL